MKKDNRDLMNTEFFIEKYSRDNEKYNKDLQKLSGAWAELKEEVNNP